MRVLLEYCLDHYSARWLYGAAAWRLRRRGVAADVVCQADDRDFAAYDVLVSHDFVDDRTRQLPRLGCWGGRALLRPAGLDLMRDLGIPVMPWALAASRDDVNLLFDRWGVERLLVKRSSSMKGRGVRLFDRAHLDRVEWTPEDDVFCPEVDASDGTVYKAELFNGRIVLEWIWYRPPLNRAFTGFDSGDKGYRSDRGLFRFPPELREGMRRLSAELTRRGFGYCSLDLMKAPSGQLVAIELNSGKVATWWSARFGRSLWRFATAVDALIADRERAADEGG